MAHACAEWEYEQDHPNFRTLLLPVVTQLLTEIANAGYDTTSAIQDTRPTHRALFRRLTPPAHPAYAGNYRGASTGDRCLSHYEVGVSVDSRVGSPPYQVAFEMRELAVDIRSLLDALDEVVPTMNSQEVVKVLVVAVAQILEWFLRIHPFVNGNGHAGRFIAWAMLARYGFHFRYTFQIDPKPPMANLYSDCLSAYRNGDKDRLHKFLAQCVAQPINSS